MKPRVMLPTDRPYVVSTWGMGSRYDGITRRERFQLVDRILDGGADVVVLARDRTVHAWACGDLGLLHYVYVPPELRKKGLARRLITELLGEYPKHINVTHPWPRESSRFRYVPNLLLRSAA